MSGGVDSSVSALLLKQRGLNVIGVYMQNWDTLDESGTCNSQDDWIDVKAVCKSLDINCIKLNLSKEYWTKVFSVVLDGYSTGITPNPDIICNSEIKFGCLMNKLFSLVPPERLDTTWFATGHYAQVETVQVSDPNTRKKYISLSEHEESEMPSPLEIPASTTERHLLTRGKDRSKDQTYFLSGISGLQLSRVLFPIGNLIKKTEVRDLAIKFNLKTAKKPESFGICFVGNRKNFSKFLSEFIPPSTDSNRLVVSALDMKTVLGHHTGIYSKTIGQSAGVTFDSQKWFVVEKDTEKNIIYAAPGHDHYLLYTQRILLNTVHWINPINYKNYSSLSNIPQTDTIQTFLRPNTNNPFSKVNNDLNNSKIYSSDTHIILNLKYQIRHLESPGDCSLIISNNFSNAVVIFHSPVYGATPGQYIAFYDNHICLGNAPISHVDIGFRL
ncbi:tRNA-specific 2-thiouridylase MnmA [Smittium culicis]|uniref:tRNA-5-taurinomethyluridine 2-sulfurtransferase n=1 Tax=Smittium culicis TaxID=133412 RepID=A0A1R1YCU4_9FUNG|nr:tRNA-specific 2-thiouridylase MnmA [Smittium culicis]OMJ24732.1 tRNA-specific 2-thiouridylase MnmA [Smittium culicis]